MTDVLDMLFDDEEAQNAPPPAAPTPAAYRGDITKGRPPKSLTLSLREDRKTPIPREHVCDHPGCTKWGPYGLALTNAIDTLKDSAWWCSDHLPDWWFG